MTERVRLLRHQSLDAVPTLSHERALILTRWYRSAGSLPPPLLRARALEAILNEATVCINDGELIVGERGPAPKATSR